MKTYMLRCPRSRGEPPAVILLKQPKAVFYGRFASVASRAKENDLLKNLASEHEPKSEVY
jgi:hypothetical protein